MKDNNEIDEGCGCPDMAPKVRIRIVRETVNKLTEQETTGKTEYKPVGKESIVAIITQDGKKYKGAVVKGKMTSNIARRRARASAEKAMRKAMSSAMANQRQR